MALALGCPGTEIPYSVSMPITRRTVMRPSLPGGAPFRGRRSSTAACSVRARSARPALRERAVRLSLERPRAGGEINCVVIAAVSPAAGRKATGCGCPAGHPQPVRLLQVLTGVGHRVDGAAGVGALLSGDERADEDDPLALLAGDTGPVVRVGGVRQVLVLLELVHACLEEVGDAKALLAVVEEGLDGHLLGPVHDVLDHRA